MQHHTCDHITYFTWIKYLTRQLGPTHVNVYARLCFAVTEYTRGCVSDVEECSFRAREWNECAVHVEHAVREGTKKDTNSVHAQRAQSCTRSLRVNFRFHSHTDLHASTISHAHTFHAQTLFTHVHIFYAITFRVKYHFHARAFTLQKVINLIRSKNGSKRVSRIPAQQPRSRQGGSRRLKNTPR